MGRYDDSSKEQPRIGLRPVGRSRTVPFRALYDRYSLLGFVALSAALLLFGRADSFLVEMSRRTVAEVATPILSIMQEPMAAIDDIGASVSAITNVYEENKQLRAEVDRLRGWEGVATGLSDENRLMRELLSMADDLPTGVRSARVVADTSTPFVRAVLINAGHRDGLEKGQAVLNHLGLVGRIDGTATDGARVLLVTDINSRIPVRLADDRVKGLATGSNGALLKISYLPEGAKPQMGERVVTSGDGGLMPAGLPVGIVEAIDKDGSIFIRPHVDTTRLDYVRVLSLPLNLTVSVEEGLPRGVALPETAAADGGAVPLHNGVPVDILMDEAEQIATDKDAQTRPTLRSLGSDQ